VILAVTGANGFIGSHLVPVLLAEGHRIAVINEPGIGGVPPNGVRSLTADITSSEGLLKTFADAEAVIHLAARNHVLKETARDPLAAYRRVNVVGTRNVMRAASLTGAKTIVHLSSVKAMGEESESILNEESRCMPKTPYGVSKMESEEVIRAESAKNGMRAIILRLPMVYGPANKGNIPRMIRWADRGRPFPIFKPDNIRSMIYVENVVAGILAVLKDVTACIATYILKDREDCSTKTIYSAICRELEKKPRFVPVPAIAVRLGGMFSKDFRKITGSFQVSSSRIEKEIGFYPPVSFEEGIARTVHWYKYSAR
jgi:nucleoside-diphosphate-sugar epimerase